MRNKITICGNITVHGQIYFLREIVDGVKALELPTRCKFCLKDGLSMMRVTPELEKDAKAFKRLVETRLCDLKYCSNECRLAAENMRDLCS